MLSHLLILLSIALLMISLFRHGQIIGFGDNIFDLSPANELAKSFPAWSNRTDYFGAIDDGASWTLWFILLWPAERLFGPGITQAMVLFCLVAGAYLAFRCFMLELRVGWRPATASGFAYAINPLTLLILNNNYPLEWMLAAVPAIALVFAKAAKRRTESKSITFAVPLLCFLLVPILAANPALLALLLVALVAAHAAISVAAKIGASYARWLGLVSAYALACSLWWLIPSATRYLTAARIANTNAASYAWVVARATLLNAMRLNTLWEWRYSDYYPFAQKTDHNTLLYGAGFLLVAFLFIAPFAARTRAVRRRLSVPLFGALIALFLSKGLHPPLTILAEMFYRLPGAFLFREPTFKFGAVAIFLLAATSGFIFRLGQARVKHKDLLLVVCCSICMLSWWPAITGAIMRGSSGPALSGELGLPSTYYRVPRYWTTLASYLQQHAAGDGVLVLPADSFYDRDYKWGLYGADYLPMWLLPTRVWTIGTSMYTSSAALKTYSGLIARYLARGDSRLPQLLRELGVRYVLFRGDLTTRSPEDIWSKAFALRFAGQNSGRNFGPLKLIDLGTPVPQIFEQPSAITTGHLEPDVIQKLLPRSESQPLIQEEPKDKRRLTIRPQLDWAYLDQFGALNIRVVDPAARVMLADLKIAALAGRGDSCTLSHLAWHETSRPQNGALKVRLLRFTNVLLLPGFNGLAISCPRWQVPGFDEQQSGGIRRGQVVFGAARLLATKNASLPTRYGQPSPMYMYAHMRPLNSVVRPGGMFKVRGVPASTADLALLFHLRGAVGTRLCFAPVDASGSVASDLAVARCMAHQGIDSPLGISISSLDVVGSSPRGKIRPNISVSASNVCGSSPCTLLGAWVNTRVSAAGCAPRCRRDPIVSGRVPRLLRLLPGLLFVFPSPGNKIVGMLQAYSDTWRAFDVRTLEPVPHTVVNGWANGWRVSGPHPIVVINVLCVAQYAAVALALGLLAVLAIRAVRKTEKAQA